MHTRTLQLLSTIGLGKHELQALSAPPLFPLSGPLETGLGLIGPTGTGKTWRLIQALGADLDVHVLTQPVPAEAKMPFRYARWINWPDASEKLKGMVAKGFHADIVDLVDAWESCCMLFLDDLGQERITGENDYSLGILRSLLDQRYRTGRAVYWTSNLPPKDLVRVYGSRIVSRMREAWPWTAVKGHDMRVSGVVA
nr:hypothetical protein [uncultured Holophaga sp.]